MPVGVSPLPLDRSFRVNGILLRYPAGWRLRRLTEVSSFTNLLAVNSNVPVPEPCHAVAHGSECGPLLPRLKRGDVLVSWVQEGMPNTSIDREPGARLTVAGHLARLGAGVASCPPGTTASLTGAISVMHQDSHDELLRLTACADGPAAQQAIATARKMFESVGFVRPL
jgi:hypothetical protein